MTFPGRISPSSSGRRTNLALLVLVTLAVVSGLFANTIGTDWPLHPSVLHGVVSLGIVVLVPWKSAIVRRGLRRRRPTAVISIVLLALVCTTIGTGLLHATAITPRLGPLTVMQVHVGGGLLALVLAAIHLRSHPVRPRGADLDRRSLLRAGGLVAVAVAMRAGLEAAQAAAGLDGAGRRFTGSHQRGSYRPAAMPVTAWFDDRTQHIDPADWTLTIGANRYRLEELAALPHDTVTAVLDCTSGWYAEQVWSGVRLDRLIDTSGRRSIEVRSATGYRRRFPVRDAGHLWLATAVGGAPLSPGHGFPARLVAPGRRGFWWVKWVVEIQPSDVPWWLQLPFPAT